MKAHYEKSNRTVLAAGFLATRWTRNSSLVKIDNFSFTPQTLTIHTGTTVTWVKRTTSPTPSPVPRRSSSRRALDTDEQFSFTFPAPGTNSYFCSVHPHMTGKIIVQ